MDGRTDRWMNGGIKEWTDGWVDGWINGRINGWFNGCRDLSMQCKSTDPESEMREFG